MAGKQKKKSFAARVHDVVRGTSGPISIEDISIRLHVQTRLDYKRLGNALTDLYRAGRVERVSRGVYSHKRQPAGQRSIQERMWAIIRARRSVTLADLQELADASENYAREYLLMLCRREIMAKQGNSYRLITDQGPKPPSNDDKAAKLRRLRAQKKHQILADLDRLKQAVTELPD